jgi:hypothetical protein
MFVWRKQLPLKKRKKEEEKEECPSHLLLLLLLPLLPLLLGLVSSVLQKLGAPLECFDNRGERLWHIISGMSPSSAAKATIKKETKKFIIRLFVIIDKLID